MRCLALLVILLTGPVTGWTHDFWLHAGNYLPGPDDSVRLEFYVGERFEGRPVALPQDRIKAWRHAGNDKELQLLPVRNRPGCIVRTTSPGARVVGFETYPAFVQLPRDRFRAYLRHEGIEDAIPPETKLAASVRERYTRCAKAILMGGGDNSGFDQACELTFEITPLDDPHSGPGSARFVLRFKGKPSAGRKLVAMHESGQTQVVRSDANGEVRVDVSRPGRWLLKSVQLVPATSDEADWHSYWASLTWERPKE